MVEAEPTHGLDQAMDVVTAHGQACNGKGIATGGRDWVRQAARRS
jgi:hypothetical protein